MTNPRHAILIGINHYNSVDFPELEFCVKDAEALGEVLRKDENYQTQLLTSTSESNPPTDQNIRAALEKVSQASTLLVYFSGHGHRDEDEKPMLVTCDGSMLPLADVIALMNRSPVPQKILLLDACFQGLETKAIASSIAQLFQKSASKREENANSQSDKPKRTAAFYSGYALFHDSEGFAMLSASTGSQTARESVALGHGYFTHHLLQGLQGEQNNEWKAKALRDNKPFVTVVDLALYAARQLRNMSWGEGFQEPTSLLAMKGDIILLETGGVTPDSRPQIVPRRMAFRYNVRFVSREDDKDKLEDTFLPFLHSTKLEIIVVTGIGGVGKTQIAGQFVYEHERDFPGGVFWLNFANGEQVLSEIADCGSKYYLNLPNYEQKESIGDKAKLVKDKWNEPNGPRRLLIFDNCENPALLRLHLPDPSSNCAVLVTSRRSEKDWPKHNLGSDEKPFFLSDSQILALGMLSEGDSLSFFEKFRKFNEKEKAILSDIANTLGRLPLALHLAGSVLGLERMRSKTSKQSEIRRIELLREYLTKLEQNLALIDNKYLEQVGQMTKGGMGEGETDTPTAHPTVGITFEITYAQLNPDDQDDKLALKLLFRAAFFKPAEPIPADLLKETVSKEEKSDAKLLRALERLVNLGLLEWAGREDVEGYAMHTLTSAFVRARAIAITHKANSTQDPPSEKDKADYEKQARDLQKELDSAQEDVEKVVYWWGRNLDQNQDIASLHKLHGHMSIITDAAKKRKSYYSSGLCALFATYLHEIGDEAVKNPQKYYDYALETCDQAEDSSYIASVLYVLAELMLIQLGDYQRAKDFHERALQIREKGTNQLDLTESLDGMSMALRYLGRYSDGITYARRAVAIREQNILRKVLSASHSRLGLLLLDMGMYAEAKEYLAKALEIDEKKNQESLVVAVDLDNLAMVMTELKEYATARAHIERSMAILRKTFQLDDPINLDMAIAYRILGKLLYAQGNLPEARNYFERALAIHKERFGENYLQAATRSIHQLLAAYVLLLRDQGDHSEALKFAKADLDTCMAKLGVDHPATAESLHTLALLTAAEGNSQEAVELMRQALAIREAKLGPAHPLTQASRQQLADLEQKLSQA